MIYICCILCRHVDCICTILVIVKQLKYTPSGSLSAVLSHKTLFFSSCLLYSCWVLLVPFQHLRPFKQLKSGLIDKIGILIWIIYSYLPSLSIYSTYFLAKIKYFTNRKIPEIGLSGMISITNHYSIIIMTWTMT